MARRPHRLRRPIVLLLPAIVAAAIFIGGVAANVPGLPTWVVVSVASVAAAVVALITFLVPLLAPELIRKEIQTWRDLAIAAGSTVMVFVVGAACLVVWAPTNSPPPTSAPTLAAAVTPTPTPTSTPSPTPAPSPEPTPPTETLIPSEPLYSPGPQPPWVVPAVRGGPAEPTATLRYPGGDCNPGFQGEACRWVHVEWVENNPEEVTIRIYAVTRCAHEHQQCIQVDDVIGDDPEDQIHTADLVLIKEVDAQHGKYDFMMRPETRPYRLDQFLGVGGPVVFGYFVQAVSRHGGSRPVIVDSAVH